MLNLVNEQTVYENMDEFINAQKEATGFDLRYTSTMSRPRRTGMTARRCCRVGTSLC